MCWQNTSSFREISTKEEGNLFSPFLFFYIQFRAHRVVILLSFRAVLYTQHCCFEKLNQQRRGNKRNEILKFFLPLNRHHQHTYSWWPWNDPPKGFWIMLNVKPCDVCERENKRQRLSGWIKASQGFRSILIIIVYTVARAHCVWFKIKAMSKNSFHLLRALFIFLFQ